MPRILPVAKRVIQRSALGASNGIFNGNVKIQLLPVDTAKLTFSANITVNDATPNAATYTPCDDNGKVRVFSDVDGVVSWVRGAYTDVLSVSMDIADFDVITKTFVPPTDALKDAVSKKASFTKLQTGLVDNLAAANTEITRAATAGWNAVDAHPALQANYAELVAKRDAIEDANDYYVARIAFYEAIINPI